ncbi:MAG: glycoside hydrolase family 15 protein [Elusimicrobiales bacterium]|nr:glycoside hydrolase family 15 protein [Elusimicrobiales bacterium]
MYRPIGDYGLIGDMRSLALVSRDGSVDYCSMPRPDSPTVFAALLDDAKGGYFSVRPAGEFSSSRRYLPGTAILVCEFSMPGGARASLTDFMPVGPAAEAEASSIHRCLRAEAGTARFLVRLDARPGYAEAEPSVEKDGELFFISLGDQAFTFSADAPGLRVLRTDRGGIELDLRLADGGEAHFDFFWGRRPSVPGKAGCPFAATRAFWEDWSRDAGQDPAAPDARHTAALSRSLLTLKLLTYHPTGAITAAATTSLPEVPGGVRNWDYRFTWLRDASFTLRALFSMGHMDEARAFARWLRATYRRHGSRDLRIMYAVDGGADLEEQELAHLAGYRNSRPVRTGNGAFRQRQWDIYGEVMDAALRLSDYAGQIDEELWGFFREVCELAAAAWKEPDEGIWEVRNGPFHFVYSKIMCWVALDRGTAIARRYGFEAPVGRWERIKGEIKAEVLERGYDAERGTLVQRYGSKELDASLLLAGLVGFLNPEDPRFQGTIDACRRELDRNGFLLRYASPDGLPGEEGAFLLCNFWLAEALALAGRAGEARSVLERTLGAANDLGLLAEEYDFRSGEQLGNFPQAFSHIGHINAAAALFDLEERRKARASGPSLLRRAFLAVSPRIRLNKGGPPPGNAPADAGAALKTALNRLQGRFFDVHESRVDYEAMRGSDSFARYLELARTLDGFDPARLDGDAERKAFWINVYNALIIHGVIALGVRRSVKEVFNFFGRIGYGVGGRFFTPDHIEHGILRANRPHPRTGARVFGAGDPAAALAVRDLDPRVHFALVCAASSCPPIEFYDGPSIDRQLDLAARSFVNRRGLEIDREKSVVRLSRIFEWYAADFGGEENAGLRYAARFAAAPDRDFIGSSLGRLRVEYLPYDWDLNRRLA